MWVAGRFELLRHLGSGASSQVHAAHDHQLGRLVALKTLVPQPGTSATQAAELQARFAAEGQRAQQLKHPDIVTVLEVGCHDGRASGIAHPAAWLAMELVPGAELTRYTRAGRLLPEPLVLHIGERLALALAHAHAAGLVHRDLKPANVIAHWPSQTLKVVDFGLARSADAEATRTGLVLGSPAYMAPEQLAGSVPDARSDFYALGVLLYQLFSGHLPFETGNLGELLRRVANEAAPDLRSWRPQLPEALAEVVAGLLERQPARRSADGPALAATLRALREGWPAGAMSR
jgi:serine/threonine-protein kinase